MYRAPQGGLTKPAVAGRGLSEGLGNTRVRRLTRGRPRSLMPAASTGADRPEALGASQAAGLVELILGMAPAGLGLGVWGGGAE
jgi:hypothetical protein